MVQKGNPREKLVYAHSPKRPGNSGSTK